jgi:hypothetical protein
VFSSPRGVEQHPQSPIQREDGGAEEPVRVGHAQQGAGSGGTLRTAVFDEDLEDLVNVWRGRVVDLGSPSGESWPAAREAGSMDPRVCSDNSLFSYRTVTSARRR